MSNSPWMQLRQISPDGADRGSIICTAVGTMNHQPVMMCASVTDFSKPAEATYCYFDQQKQATNCDIFQLRCTGTECVVEHIAKPDRMLTEYGIYPFQVMQPAAVDVGRAVQLTTGYGMAGWLDRFRRFSKEGCYSSNG